MEGKQHEHAASMLLKLKASQEETLDTMGHRDAAEIALQMIESELTSERHQFNRIITSRDLHRDEVDRIVRKCREGYAGARNENENLIYSFNCIRASSTLPGPIIEKWKLSSWT